MATTVCYRLYSSAWAAGVSNAATAQIVKSGRITAISWDILGTGGGAGGLVGVELNINAPAGASTGVFGVNNPQRTIIAGQAAIMFGTSTPRDFNYQHSNISIDVKAGDYLNMGSILTSGTAPATMVGGCCVYVLEN